jgi:quercetin dioxygenase-like cupin family protein
MRKVNKDEKWVINKEIEGSSPAPGIVRKVLAYCDSMMCVEHYIDSNTDLAQHSHPHAQIAYVVEGSFRFTIGDETREVTKGDTLYVPGDIKHGAFCLEKGLVVDFFTPMREDFVK